MTTQHCFRCTSDNDLRDYAYGPDTMTLCPDCARAYGYCAECGKPARPSDLHFKARGICRTCYWTAYWQSKAVRA